MSTQGPSKSCQTQLPHVQSHGSPLTRMSILVINYQLPWPEKGMEQARLYAMGLTLFFKRGSPEGQSTRLRTLMQFSVLLVDGGSEESIIRNPT